MTMILLDTERPTVLEGTFIFTLKFTSCDLHLSSAL